MRHSQSKMKFCTWSEINGQETFCNRSKVLGNCGKRLAGGNSLEPIFGKSGKVDLQSATAIWLWKGPLSSHDCEVQFLKNWEFHTHTTIHNCGNNLAERKLQKERELQKVVVKTWLRKLRSGKLVYGVVRRLHTSSINLPKTVSSLEKVGEVWPWGQAQS